MKKHILLLSLLSFFTVGCSSVDVVRQRTIPSLIDEIHRSGDTKYRKRVVISGWAKHGFETSVIFGTREDLDAGRYEKSIWLAEPPPVPDTTWEDLSNERYSYQVFKITLTGTIRSELRMILRNGISKGRAEGHMGISPARLVDIDYGVPSDIETSYFPWRKSDEPKNTKTGARSRVGVNAQPDA